MGLPNKSNDAGQTSVSARRVAELRRVAVFAKRRRMKPLTVCRAILEGTPLHPELTKFFAGLEGNERHYWIASLYALLMPKMHRRKLSAYFTPPHLAELAINNLVRQGLKLGSERVLDPASGGAAFLVPLASSIARLSREAGDSSQNAIKKISATLAGIEIEPDLAKLSELLLVDILRSELSETREPLKIPIQRRDTLRTRPKAVFDAVIVNPPYGRVFRPPEAILSNFSEVISESYVNLYALFIRQALGWVRPDGLACFIIPMSFLGGPYFSSLRKYILENASVLSLDPIEQRSDLFLDVLCDVCVLTLRKHGAMKRSHSPTSSLLRLAGPPLKLGQLDIPAKPIGRIWALPNSSHSEKFFANDFESLESYGFSVKSGYFVWNREQHRYRLDYKPTANEVPLYWAHNIKANADCHPFAGDPSAPKKCGFVRVEHDSSAVIWTDAILVQRTSNSRQKRRLIASIVRQRNVLGSRGFVSENHTLVIIPTPGRTRGLPLSMLCRLLNSAAVDSRFRRISGTVSVSTSALRALPLPCKEHVRNAFSTMGNDDAAAEMAYRASQVAKEKLAEKVEVKSS